MEGLEELGPVNGDTSYDCWMTDEDEMDEFVACVASMTNWCEEISVHEDPAGPNGEIWAHAECLR